MSKKKVAYLFGAGATHAEIIQTEEYTDLNGLLTSDLTRRVFLKAKGDDSFLSENRFFFDRSAAESSNIELFISFLENNSLAIKGASSAVDNLKSWVEIDIKSVLTEKRKNKFILHKALLELHKNNEDELICGLISLNYDDVLDEAYKSHYEKDPDYRLSSAREGDNNPPLLKLHGSFNWDAVKVAGKIREVPIIPLNINKNYLQLPYNFIWGSALEVLAECDILRVIGCSLSPHDINLVDLLFKAHLEKKAGFEIQIISPDKAGQEIKRNYSFFPKIIIATEIEETLLPEADDTTNVFEEWLKAKGRKVLKDDSVIQQTTYLQQIIL